MTWFLRPILCAFGFAAVLAAPAHAVFKVCNEMDGFISVAHGYPVEDGQYSQGWENIASGECQVLVEDSDAAIETYFWRSVANNFTFPTSGRAFCVSDDAFVQEKGFCEEEGFQKLPFEPMKNLHPNETVLTIRPPDSKFGVIGGTDRLSHVLEALQGVWTENSDNTDIIFNPDSMSFLLGTGTDLKVVAACQTAPDNTGTYITFTFQGDPEFCWGITDLNADSFTLEILNNNRIQHYTRVEFLAPLGVTL